MEELRVIGKFYIYPRNSNGEIEEGLIQYLQKKTKRKFSLFGLLPEFYWRTIDTETVPSFAWIQRNVLGFTDWKSKFANLDGVKFCQNKKGKWI